MISASKKQGLQDAFSPIFVPSKDLSLGNARVLIRNLKNAIGGLSEVSSRHLASLASHARFDLIQIDNRRF